MEKVFFDSWASLGRTLIIGILAYAGLILMLRISGKRTLSKMNSFDLVVTVALGSSLATVLLTKQVPLVDGLLAFGLLMGLQFAVTWLSVRSKTVERITRAEPTLLLHRGEFLEDAMKFQRMTRSEIIQAIRSQGFLNIDDVQGIVLESDGSLSVVGKTEREGSTSLDRV